MLSLLALPLILILALALLCAIVGAALSATSTIVAQLSGLIYAALALLAGIMIGFTASEYRHICRTLGTQQPTAQRIEAVQSAALPVARCAPPMQSRHAKRPAPPVAGEGAKMGTSYPTPAMLRPVVSDMAGDWWGGDDE